MQFFRAYPLYRLKQVFRLRRKAPHLTSPSRRKQDPSIKSSISHHRDFQNSSSRLMIIAGVTSSCASRMLIWTSYRVGALVFGLYRSSSIFHISAGFFVPSTYVITEGEIVDMINFLAFFAFFVHTSNFVPYSDIAASYASIA